MNISSSNFPLVSICIPTYNGEDFIEDALNSALGQTYKNIEIIISDDDSKDTTLEIIRSVLETTKIPYSIYNHSPKGIGTNWNNCVINSNGEYIKFLFQDDLLRNDCVEKMMDLMLSYPKAGMIYCKRNFIYDNNNIDHLNWLKHNKTLHEGWDELDVKEGVLNGTRYLKDLNLMNEPLNKIGEPTAVLLKKECFDKIGYFNPVLKQTLDFEYWYRLMKAYKVGFIDEELVYFRLHPNQATFVNKRSNVDEIEILKDSFYKKIFWDLHPKRKWKLFKSQSIIGNWVRYIKRLVL